MSTEIIVTIVLAIIQVPIGILGATMPETRGRIPPIIAGISALLILALLGVYLGDAISDKQVMFGSIGITAISIIIACIFIFKHKGRAEDKNNTSRDGGLLLLELLDESYQRLKAITRMTIKKLRSKKWEDMHESIPFYISSLTNIDIDSEIENIMAKNLYLFATGKTLTVIEDGKELAKKMKESPLFMRNPEDVSKDASILLKEKLPYLKKKIDRDRTYNKFLKKIERERDKYPSEDVSKAIDAFLDHSIKLNATYLQLFVLGECLMKNRTLSVATFLANIANIIAIRHLYLYNAHNIAKYRGVNNEHRPNYSLPWIFRGNYSWGDSEHVY